MMKRIPLEQITRNPDQPRQTFEPVALRDLADSIDQNGLAQPITVRPMDPDAAGHRYMIVMGERRFRAHQLLAEGGKVTDILAHVRKMDDGEMHINAILENLQRSAVSPLEEAAAYKRMIDDFDFTPETLAVKLGISQSWRIPYRIKLLNLTDDNRALVAKGILTMTQAYHMAGLSPNGQQSFLVICRSGLAQTEKSASQAAAAIAAKEAQIEMPMPEQARPRASIKSIEDRIDALGAALKPLLKDGTFELTADIDPNEGQRCSEKLRLLRATIGNIEREISRAASVSAAA